MSKRITALKRINKDLLEITQSPLEGIGIGSINEDPMIFAVNIELMCGPYKGYKTQLKMTITEEYPMKPPKVLIYPNQAMGNNHNHRIFNDKSGYKGFCMDILDNQFHMDTKGEYTGWNPVYTISSILLQVQNFLSNPDLPQVPIQKSIETLMNSMEKYERTLRVGNEYIVHTWKNPYPEMHYSNKYTNDDKMKKEEHKEKKDNTKNDKGNSKKEIIKENLTCHFTKENYLDNPEIILGYPILKNTSVYDNDKIELYPIPQLLSYEAYQMQMSNKQSNDYNSLIFNHYNETEIKTSYKQFFNNWLPIYVNEAHYVKNKEKIKNAIKTIKNEDQFNPNQIFDIFPIILNKMIIGVFKGKANLSMSFIKCYYHYVLLFKRLCKEYKNEFDAYVDKKINLIKMNDYEVDKIIIPDIGEFFILIFLSNKDMSSAEMKQIKKALVQEFLTRQIYWIFHAPGSKVRMKSKVISSNMNIDDDIYLDLFHTEPNFKMNYQSIFNKELHRKNIYPKVINTIANDWDFIGNHNNKFYYAKKDAEYRITQNFKRLYNECGNWGRNKLNVLIKENMRFDEFLEKDQSEIKALLYEKFRVDELLRGNTNNNTENAILKNAYESQPENQILLINYLVLNKLKEKGFMEELEQNYGVYIDVCPFFKNMGHKLKEIKSYKELFEFIQCEVDNDSEIELIINAYEKAREKGYIKEPYEVIRVYANRYDVSY